MKTPSFLEKLLHVLKLRFRRGEKINIEYPISWETMSAEDFRNVCIILSDRHGRKESLFLCLCALAHIRPDNPIKYDPKAIRDNVVFIIGGKSYVISPKVITEACNQLSFIYDSVGLAPSPLMKVDRKLYGISFAQFFEADACMMRYAAENNDKWLKEVAKILTSGRVRKLLPWQLKGIVIWWNGVKEYLKNKYPAVFQEGSGSSYADMTMEDILYELLSTMNGDKPQDNEKILESDVHAVLFCLNNKFEKNAHNRIS